VTARSDHFDGRRFFNPGGANGQPFWLAPSMLLTPRTRWPSTVPVDQKQPPQTGPGDVVVTFIGHASFLLQIGDIRLLIDPVYSERASPLSFVGPRRVRAPGVRFDDLPPISCVLLSHNHYDHCDLRTLRALDRRFHMPIVTPVGNRRLLQSAGIEHIEELDWWENAHTAPLPVALTPAQHFSARHPFDRNRALWAGFLIEASGRRILFAGDTGYGAHFREIAARLGPIDFALIPIGAYEPRWFMGDQHMNPSESVQAFIDSGAEVALGHHYGTFQLTDEPIDAPLIALADALTHTGIPAERFRALRPGQVWQLS
jgi:L-ascorbate metabolism protein UlaG (beta-lactamase superfamily)